MRLPLITSISLLIVACGPPDISTGGDSGGSGSPAADAGPADDGCPDEHFLDVSQSEGPGDDYAAPTLNVYCDDTEVFVESNGMPNYLFQSITPNPLGEQDYTWHFPKTPQAAPAESSIPLLGAVAVVINGLPVYGPNEAERPDPFGDPVHNDILDGCKGHTGGNQDYHNHTLIAECLMERDGVDDPSAIWAFAFDGYPIYGPVGCVDSSCSRLIEYRSSWVQTGDPTTYAWDNHEYRESDDEGALDRCNGHVGPGGDYHYHVTSSFPYVLGCYHGVATANGGQRGGGGGNPGGGPPQAAQDACEGGGDGDACSFEAQGGRTITGTCQVVGDGILACVRGGAP
jgi:hypothetical protein